MPAIPLLHSIFIPEAVAHYAFQPEWKNGVLAVDPTLLRTGK